jgi:transcription initiation factor TFIID subunit 2
LDGTPREPSPAPPATDEAGPAPMDVEESRQQEPDLQSPALPTVPVSLAPITIGIDFALVNPRTGLHFALPDAAHYPHRWPHAHSTNLRDIMPCLDSLRDKGTWDLEFVVPRDLTRFDG